MLRATTFLGLCSLFVCASSVPADEAVKIWEPAQIWETPHRIFALAMSQDGKLVAAAGSHGIVTLWNSDEGKLIKFCTGSRDDSTCVAISPDKKLLAVGGIEGDVQVFDVEKGKVIYSFVENRSRLMHVDFTADGKMIFSTCWDASMRCWNAADGKSISKTDAIPIGKGMAALGPIHGEVIVPALFPGFALRPHVPTNSPLKTVSLNGGVPQGELPQDETTWSICTTPHRPLMAVGTSTGKVHVWDMAERKKIAHCTIETPGHDDTGRGIVGLSIINEAKHLFIMTMNGFGGIYSAVDGSVLKRIERPTIEFASVAVAPNASKAIISQWNQKIELFDLTVAANDP
ncbi:hypothetical protein K2Y11_25090 [bacterium]|nr:hypothetical protein [bacterium]